MSQPHSSRAGAILLLLASLAGLAIALYADSTPLTGVTGTLGARLTAVACGVLAILALGLAALRGRAPRILLRVLILLGLAGTAFAGLLLHQVGIAVAMGIGLVGLIVDMLRSPRPTRSAHA